VGVLHVHSRHSDGTGTIPHILSAARRNRLDYVVVTDHNNLEAGKWQGWRDGVLLVAGVEVTPTANHNHYLALGIDRPVTPDRPAAEYVDEVRARGGFGFVAHPSDRGSHYLGLPSFAWHAWDVPISGLEVWNFLSRWVGAVRTGRDLVRGLADPRNLVAGPDPQDLARWDALGKRRRVAGVGGVDAHGSPGMRLRLLSYARMFRMLRTHVLVPVPFVGDDAQDTGELLGALQAGRCFMVAGSGPTARGFRFTARQGPACYHQGDEVCGEALLEVSLPVDADMRLLRDGGRLAEGSGRRLSHRVDTPGVYRVEVHRRAGRRRQLWILSNPIYLRCSRRPVRHGASPV